MAETSRRVVVLAPHPDDEAIGCGGTIAAHVAGGDDVRLVFLTSGEKGHPTMDPAEFRSVRESEAMRAASVLDVPHVEFWRLPDGALRVTHATTARLTESVDGADVVYVTNPAELHADHRAAARLARAAVGRCAAPPRLLTYEIWTPLTKMDEINDIGPHLETKLAAIRCHASQCELIDFAAAAKGLARYRGEMFSWPEGDYAEVFQELRADGSRR